MKTMIAKYPGTCVACSKPIVRGQVIRFLGRGRAEHRYCFQPDGEQPINDRRAPCWICKNPEGKFRNRGAASPVWCDACNEIEQAKTKTVGNVRFTPDRFDMQVEDNMRDACGL